MVISKSETEENLLILADLINAANCRSDDRPLAVFYISVTADFMENAGQVDLVRRVDPRLQLHRTQLVVERVEDHIQIARDGVDTARLPACVAVATDGDEKSSIVVVIKQFIRASLTTPFISHAYCVHI